MPLTAKQLDEKYHDELRKPPLSDCTSARYLFNALTGRRPPVPVSEAACKHWFLTHRVVTTVSVSSAKELDEKHGDQVRLLAPDNRTAYYLCKALRECDPPVFVSDGVAKHWLHNYFGPMQKIESAGRLEVLYGQKLRAEAGSSQRILSQFTGAEVSQFLLDWNVSVPASICHHWLKQDWSSSGYLLTLEQLGGPLRDVFYKK